ncbi:MAG: Lrp/AsnC family transcriptional regulator [Methylobacterium radiotolerans]
MKLTNLDGRIIKLLSEDSRMPALRIAELLEEPESTVRGRINRLVEAKVIEFVAQTNPVEMGFSTWVMIGLKVALPLVPDVVDRLQAFEEVYFVAVTTGGYDVMLNAVFEDSDALHRFIVERLGGIEGIRDTNTFHYLAVPKRKIAFLPVGEPEKAGERRRGDR